MMMGVRKAVLRVISVVMKRSPRERATASAKMALEIV